MAKYVLDYAVVNRRAKLLHQLLPHSDHALLDAVFLRVALRGNGLTAANIHDVHRAVSDVTKHGDAAKIVQPVRDSSETLRINLSAREIHMIGDAPESEVCARLLEKIRFEGCALFADPCERQTGGKVNAGCGHTP